ncbi:CBS domain-containing protein [Aestuariirhabdus sp. Z084]|uniref:CBS domain-containing protein n=1 Tax=Aestuariirhabdus haliotis TaxID=2918751 RepID=UPI00201B3DFA|nr:CBS domain-containing protein [Aestuariirhabdus haliotis]MCL6415309.1 CBS domain-containing protein [Aestuariirhabdus haliotis]MCL6419569.1 CBS domain-containing protein [Aestuariirhabdus haliotis]
MNLGASAQMTSTLSKGDTLEKLFRDCADYRVSTLPVVDQQGIICGAVSLHDLLAEMMLPDYLAKAAHVLGDEAAMLHAIEPDMDEWCSKLIDDYITDKFYLVTPESSLTKGLALMTGKGTSCLFVVENDTYRGIVTRITIVQRLLDKL